MSLPVISVIIPTVDGRESDYYRCVRAYRMHAEGQYELDLIVERNQPTCGWGWQAGSERIRADSEYVHLTCDDIEPQSGWAAPAIKALEQHYLPAPRVVNGHTGMPEMFPQWGIEWPDGTPAGLCCLPFLTRELWDNHVSPMLCSHYFGDNWATYRAAHAGYPARIVRGYHVRHWWASHLRGAGMGYEDRLAHDQEVFYKAAGMAERGEWTEPWPPREEA